MGIDNAVVEIDKTSNVPPRRQRATFVNLIGKGGLRHTAASAATYESGAGLGVGPRQASAFYGRSLPYDVRVTVRHQMVDAVVEMEVTPERYEAGNCAGRETSASSTETGPDAQQGHASVGASLDNAVSFDRTRGLNPSGLKRVDNECAPQGAGFDRRPSGIGSPTSGARVAERAGLRLHAALLGAIMYRPQPVRDTDFDQLATREFTLWFS